MATSFFHIYAMATSFFSIYVMATSPRGVCQKGTIFLFFFRNPSLIYECQKYFVIFSFGHEMGHGIGLAHNRSEKYWQVGVF